MPSLVFLIIFYFCPIAFNVSYEFKGRLLWLIFIATFVFPFLSTFVFFYVMKKSFSVSDILMENRKERFFPFLFSGLFYAAITYMFIRSGYDGIIIVIIGGIALSVILLAIITYFWKISAHAVGIAGVLGYSLIVSYFYPYELMLYPIGAMVFFTGILLSARLNLNAHTPAQVFSGALMGLVISVLSFIVFQKYGLALIY
ncbi:MAG: hypothetical protein K2X86_10765 [Cytophagaceae bacterium]|nr:hypothetical protein [Cytophagaceae bacterium]